MLHALQIPAQTSSVHRHAKLLWCEGKGTSVCMGRWSCTSSLYSLGHHNKTEVSFALWPLYPLWFAHHSQYPDTTIRQRLASFHGRFIPCDLPIPPPPVSIKRWVCGLRARSDAFWFLRRTKRRFLKVSSPLSIRYTDWATAAPNPHHIAVYKWQYKHKWLLPVKACGLKECILFTTYHSVTNTLSVGLWMSDRPVAETSTWQHTTLTTERNTCPRRDSNPQPQEASGLRTRGHRDRRNVEMATAIFLSADWKVFYVMLNVNSTAVRLSSRGRNSTGSACSLVKVC